MSRTFGCLQKTRAVYANQSQSSKSARLIFALIKTPPSPTDRKYFFFFPLAIIGISELQNEDPDLCIAK